MTAILHSSLTEIAVEFFAAANRVVSFTSMFTYYHASLSLYSYTHDRTKSGNCCAKYLLLSYH